MDFLANFWNLIWIFIFSFAVIAYLMILFGILRDLFLDHKLGGWWKTVWIFFLIAVPYLSAFIYLIARGRGMAERAQNQAQAAEAAAESYIKEVAGTSTADEIVKAKQLLDSGAISDTEYTSLKARLLA